MRPASTQNAPVDFLGAKWKPDIDLGSFYMVNKSIKSPGYSSLSYLKRLPVQELKIDRSFIADIETDDDDQAIVRATIRLGHDLGLNVVAEGVETRASFALLKSWGVDATQGYYFGRPIDAAKVARRLAQPNLTLVGRQLG